MSLGFWKNLPPPAMVLAPMANVTDVVFREIIARYGKPDVFWTEFVSCDGLLSPGRERLMIDLQFTANQRPIVMQLFGAKPENFYRCAMLAAQLGFDGIDINMGCPDRAVEKQGAGAALIKNPELAKQIIAATKRGAGQLPVSVKTRLGYNTIIIDEWLKHLLEAEPALITIHARTRQEMSKVPAHWDEVKKAVEIVQGEYQTAAGQRPRVFGNGDVVSRKEAETRAAETGADGIMMGRGIFGNPWFFNRQIQKSEIPLPQQMAVMLEHTNLFATKFSGIKSFETMKKHYKAYVSGWDGAHQLRTRLMAAKDIIQVQRTLQQFGYG